METFNIGIVGCGRISQAYVEAIQNLSKINLCAVLDVRREAADSLAEQSDATPYYQLDDYLKNKHTQATIICAPPSLHKNIACAVLKEGHHVLCEKPLATKMADGMKMINTASKYKRKLMMASKFRYVDDVIRAKSIIASGLLGDIIFYENCFSGKINMDSRWNSNPTISGGGVMIDNGTHSVDIVRYLIGPIQSILANKAEPHSSKEVEETVQMSFVTEKGVNGSIYLSWKFPFDRDAYIAIYGTEGRLRVNWNGSHYQSFNHSEWTSFGVGYNKNVAFQRQIENFVEHIHDIAPSLISEKDSLASLSVIQTAYRSLTERKWIDVEE